MNISSLQPHLSVCDSVSSQRFILFGHVKTEQKSYKKKKILQENPRAYIYNLTVREIFLTKSGNLINMLDYIKIKNLCKQKISETVNMT